LRKKSLWVPFLQKIIYVALFCTNFEPFKMLLLEEVEIKKSFKKLDASNDSII